MAERKEEPLVKTGDNSQKSEGRRGYEPTKIFDRLVTRDKAGQEVESWLEKIEKDPQQIKDWQIQNGATGLKAVSQQADDLFIVPTSRGNFVSGFKQSINDAAKWLSVFILRIIKKKQGKVKFKQEEEDG